MLFGVSSSKKQWPRQPPASCFHAETAYTFFSKEKPAMIMARIVVWSRRLLNTIKEAIGLLAQLWAKFQSSSPTSRQKRLVK
jgi:hypothetical protein